MPTDVLHCDRFQPMRLPKILIVLVSLAVVGAAGAQSADDTLVQAREALRKRDGVQLSAARQALQRANHPLTQWAD